MDKKAELARLLGSMAKGVAQDRASGEIAGWEWARGAEYQVLEHVAMLNLSPPEPLNEGAIASIEKQVPGLQAAVYATAATTSCMDRLVAAIEAGGGKKESLNDTFGPESPSDDVVLGFVAGAAGFFHEIDI